jgi:hypothetical protein
MGGPFGHRGERPYPTKLELPPEVQLAEWYLEKARWQNPRIRAFMGCLRLLDDVLESNFAILHSSPVRIREIWKTVREVSSTLKKDVEPLLEFGSKITKLDKAVADARLRLSFLDKELLSELAEFPTEPSETEYRDLRKLLCIATGKLHSFLLDTLGELLAGDPRSQNDSDYFMSRKFARDVEEAEWLYASVSRLDERLRDFENERQLRIDALVVRLKAEARLPGEDDWAATSAFLGELNDGLTPMLRNILGLRGIRIDEMQVLESHAREITEHCRILEEIFSAGRETITAFSEQANPNNPESMRIVQGVSSSRLGRRLKKLENNLRDLGAFVPLWLQGLCNRRALMLQKRGTSDNGIGGTDNPR